LIEHRIIKY